MEIKTYKNYNDEIEIDVDTVLISLWNSFIECEGYGSKICLNNKEFFENSFDNAYDAAWAVSYGDWRWTDEYAYFDSEGFLVSFSHWNDGNSPIDLDKIDISNLINGLKKWHKK